MARSKVEYPNLTNATPGGIVDMCAPDQAEMNRLKKVTDFLKTALKARLDDKLWSAAHMGYVIKGEKYTAIVTTEQQRRFNIDLAKTKMSAADFEACYAPLEVTFVRFDPNTD